MVINSLLMARLLLIIAFLISLKSLSETNAHVLDPTYVFSQLADGELHVKFHLLREIMGDLGSMLIVGIILFQPAARRFRILWWVMALEVLFYYGAFFIGYLTIGVGAPSPEAKIVHAVITIAGFAGVLLARKSYSR